MSIEVQKTASKADPFDVFSAFRPGEHAALLESARPGVLTGRFSVVARRPFLTLRHERGLSSITRGTKRLTRKGDPLALLAELLEENGEPGPASLPPFTVGAIGYLGYECGRWLEPSASQGPPKVSDFPDLCFHFFDHSLVWDHQKGETLFCARRTAKDADRQSLLRLIENVRPAPRPAPPRPSGPMRLERSFSERSFAAAVRKAKAYIRRGDIFQANLAQRFRFAMLETPRTVYSRLREINPSPFFGIFDGGDFQVVSGSPERLLKLEGRSLETRPIAGTRSRGKNEVEDRRQGLELLLSEKERAEHIMLVDLERNDLGRVAEYGSVSVDELMALEDYSHVKHIVSNVRATLRAGLGPLDALKAAFPGGTITGAPKVRCMQIIDELEPVARGPYTGSLGYFSATGAMDFNILIRSLAVRDGQASLHVGAGIVADSDPAKEHDETLYKAEAVLTAVFGQKAVQAFLRRSGAAAARVH